MPYIEISDESLDEIMKQEMLTRISYLLQDIERVKKTNHGYVFSKDPKIDLLKLTALVDAYTLILEEYGVNVEQT